ncbi:MAG: response regulator [Acidobacteriota bacterium]
MGARVEVLVVDEEPVIGELFRATLDPERFHVQQASSEKEAVRLLAEPIDVLLLHRCLPDATCEGLVRSARSQGEPVLLLLSSQRSLEAERNMLRLGAAEILYKPLDPVEVRACLERNLRPQRPADDVPGGPRLLVVDDDEMVLRSVQDTLAGKGYRVTGTASPYRALELLREGPYEILLSDLMMEELSGIELIRAALNTRPTLRAIVMTGYASKDAAVGAMREGAYDFLEKPLTPEVVRQTVARAWKALRYQLENRRLLAALGDELAEKQRMLAERESLIADLEVKNTELERFAYTVSHDLKSPLVTIQGFLGLLRQDLDAGDRQRVDHDFERLVAAAGTMQRLLDDLLELTRVGRHNSPPEAARLSELAQEAAGQLAAVLHEHGIEVAIAPDLPTVRGDRRRLQEVFLNLIENAAKFMGDQASPEVVIAMRSDDGEPVITVRDNGTGVAPDYHEKIFGLFDQLDPGSSGSGVGLALVKRIVEFHGGRVWVESAGPGSGSTFCFTLSPG